MNKMISVFGSRVAQEELDEIRSSLEAQWMGIGPKVKKFEIEFTQRLQLTDFAMLDSGSNTYIWQSNCSTCRRARKSFCRRLLGFPALMRLPCATVCRYFVMLIWILIMSRRRQLNRILRRKQARLWWCIMPVARTHGADSRLWVARN